MSYCLNPYCPNPQNPDVALFCVTCGTKLLLKERYRAIKQIGQGGFGKTFLAVDEDKPSKPPCVIKQFFPLVQGASNLQKASELFNQEAIQLDELGQHPQIPDLLAYFTLDNQQYLIQEFIDGQTLSEELAQNGTFNETQVKQFLNDLLPILHFVHSHHVIHRDIKPDNIIRRKSDRKLFLVDFGASKTASGTALQKTGTSIGSPEYVAPEQTKGRAVFASDIYSLGVTSIHLLTGKSPFDLYDMNQDAWIWSQIVKNPVSQQMKQILDKMLQTAINHRYQSAAQVIKELNTQTPPLATPRVQAPINTPPIKSPTPVAPTNQIKSRIDDELAELRSEFINPGTSYKNQPSSSQKAQTPNSNPAKSQIDIELEELRSQFQQGNKN